MKNFLHLLSLSLLFTFSTKLLAADTLVYSDIRVPEAPPGAQVMAAFMNIKNTTGADIDITSASSPQFKTVELHLTKDVDGVAKMIPQQKFTVPANESLLLKPGSYHIMLIKPKQSLRDGDMVSITLKLSDNSSKTLDVMVKKSKTKMRMMKCGEGKCGGGKCGSGKCGGK